MYEAFKCGNLGKLDELLVELKVRLMMFDTAWPMASVAHARWIVRLFVVCAQRAFTHLQGLAEYARMSASNFSSRRSSKKNSNDMNLAQVWNCTKKLGLPLKSRS